MILDVNVNYNTTFLSEAEREELAKTINTIEGKKRFVNGIYCSWVYYDKKDKLWYQGDNLMSDRIIIDARTLFSEPKNKVFFSKPKGLVYLEDVNSDFTKYNIGIKFTNGVKAILVAKNKSEFFLVDDNIIIDSLEVFDDIFNVVSEKDEVFVFGTFIELLEWKSK